MAESLLMRRRVYHKGCVTGNTERGDRGLRAGKPALGTRRKTRASGTPFSTLSKRRRLKVVVPPLTS
jgi:hypothetical protein